MQQHRLISEQLIVTINFKGAEICSIQNKTGIEFIWQANKDIWPRHAPVLFPIVGRLKNNQFSHQGQTYALSQHGFARDFDFDLVEQREDFCLFELRSSFDTLSIFPFEFVFQIAYRLQENTLVTEYRVTNTSRSPILFSVGAHPGFRCPILASEKWTDYYLEFDSSDFLVTTLSNGLRTDEKKKLFLKNKQLPLSPELFDNDALVFENNQINTIKLSSRVSTHQITLVCKDWPYFGIWAKPGCRDFVCLEPWYGIADMESRGTDFISKEGIVKLEALKDFNCSFSINIR